MPKEIVNRATGQTIFRYRGHEMSGPLPPVLYKYLPLQYAQALIETGELMFSTLSWFKQLEDKQRGDRLEGTHVHRPEDGLEIIVEQKRTLSQHSLRSDVAGQDYILIYSTSLQRLDNFYAMGENVCVEIHNPAKFKSRLKVRLHRWPPIAKTPLIHDRVRYYATEDPPGTTYALPDRIVMHKHEDFRDQHEYRFAFGTRSDVFDYERVRWTLQSGDTVASRGELNESDHRLKIWIGSLTDCCRLL